MGARRGRACFAASAGNSPICFGDGGRCLRRRPTHVTRVDYAPCGRPNRYGPEAGSERMARSGLGGGVCPTWVGPSNSTATEVTPGRPLPHPPSPLSKSGEGADWPGRSPRDEGSREEGRRDRPEEPAAARGTGQGSAGGGLAPYHLSLRALSGGRACPRREVAQCALGGAAERASRRRPGTRLSASARERAVSPPARPRGASGLRTVCAPPQPLRAGGQ